jgi:hypothetical protein
MSYTNGLDKPDLYFNTVLYSGDNASDRAITGVGFQPDLVWIKNRNNTNSHHWVDSVRGLLRLSSQDTAAEQDVSSAFKSFDSDGFTVTEEVNFELNNSGKTYASWNWLASNTTASNTDGSITSTVSANTTSGFSIVSYTVPSSGTFTVGHGLTVKPDLIITKGRGSADNWVVYHKSISSSNEDDYINLNTTDATSTITDIWGTAQPSSTVVGMNAGQTLIGSQNAIAYCFAEKKGFSKFGSYIGNGSTNGTFIYTGFKPAMVIVKQSNTSRNWLIMDNKRNEFNDVDKFIKANTSDAEGTTTLVDFTSNGFKCRTTDTGVNESGGTYIYMAFAENPFVTSTSIPCTAR